MSSDGNGARERDWEKQREREVSRLGHATYIMRSKNEAKETSSKKASMLDEYLRAIELPKSGQQPLLGNLQHDRKDDRKDEARRRELLAGLRKKEDVLSHRLRRLQRQAVGERKRAIEAERRASAQRAQQQRAIDEWQQKKIIAYELRKEIQRKVHSLLMYK